MRGWLTFLTVCTAILVQGLSAARATNLAASPQFIDIGPMRHDALPTTNSLLLVYENPNGDCHINIGSIGLKTGTPGLSLKVVGPTQLTKASPVGMIEVTYKPSKSGKFQDQIVVAYTSNCKDLNRQISVLVTASVLCTNPFEDCSPIGPLCVVDQNKQPMTKLTLDATAFPSDIFFTTIAKPLAKIMREHYATLGSYNIAFQQAASAAGIGAFIEMPPSECCANCDAGCPSLIQFKRVPYSDRIAEFTWQNKNPQDFKEKGAISTIFKMSLQFPAISKGRMIMSPDGLEFHFLQPGPTLTFTTQGAPIYSGSVSCLRGSFYQGVVRQVNPGSHTPNLDMLIEAN